MHSADASGGVSPAEKDKSDKIVALVTAQWLSSEMVRIRKEAHYCNVGIISFLKRSSELTTFSWARLPMWNMPMK